MKSFEHEALKIKYEIQMPSIVTVKIEPDPDPTADKVIMSFGSFGYVKIYGKMTENQRSIFIRHIEKYIKLLFSECEAEVKFRKEWDDIQEDIDGDNSCLK